MIKVFEFVFICLCYTIFLFIALSQFYDLKIAWIVAACICVPLADITLELKHINRELIKDRLNEQK